MEGKNYGKELILDLHNCDPSMMNRVEIEVFMVRLCDLIKMQRRDLHFWDYVGCEDEYHNAAPHLKGTSAINFITTSNITIHTLDEMKRVYLNIFTCKDFDPDVAADFCEEYFKGSIVNKIVVDRV